MRYIPIYIFIMLTVSSAVSAPPPDAEPPITGGERYIDNETYIDANNILMFVTNHGNFGRDLAGVFGNDYGTYYPYNTVNEILDGTLDNSVLYAGGIWIGGKVNGQIRVAIAEYDDEYVPGPMAGGTYQPDNPAFKVYKLYRDSLAGNPNSDYLNWPVDQGAPVDGLGEPLMLGDQMLWTVFNDADWWQHGNNAGETDPLGVEVQQTVWAEDQDGDITIPTGYTFRVSQLGSSGVTVGVGVVYPEQVTGDDYAVVIDSVVGYGPVWHVINTTLGMPVLENQTNFSGDDNYPIADGLKVIVTGPPVGVSHWSWSGNTRPFTGFDWGGSGFFGGVGLGTEFFGSSIDSHNPVSIEIRWVVDGAGQSAYCYRRDHGYDFDGYHPYQNMTVWDIASMPERQLNFAFVEYYDPSEASGWVADSIWNPGEQVDQYGNPDWEGGREYFFVLDSDYSETPIPKYMVDQALWNDYGDFDCLIGGWVRHRRDDGKPDPGDVWTIHANWGNPGIPDTFTFPTYTSLPNYSSGPEGMAIYIKYKLYNKGSNTIDDFYFSLWSDPDLGQFTDDLVGCDSLNDAWFCYNGDGFDNQYGTQIPAVGFKILKGMLAPSPGDVGDFDGNPVANHANLGMTAFSKYINGTDPDNYMETYNYMQGLQQDGSPWPNGSKYAVPGDPVTGAGDIDFDPADRRMMGSCGPITFAPGDSQYVLVKFAVGQGPDRLSSITELKYNLNFTGPTELMTVIRPNPQYLLYRYALTPIMDTIFITRQGSDAIGAVDHESLVINGSLIPSSVTPMPSHPDFEGEVLALIIPAVDFMEWYDVMFGIHEETFTVTGSLAGGAPLELTGAVTVMGLLVGDANTDGDVNVGDVVYLIDYTFSGAPAPEPVEIADANGDGAINVADAVYLISFIFKNGPEPIIPEHTE